MKPSIFKKQNLNAKQKAILMYWQKTKGVYVQNNSVAIEKANIGKYIPPFTEKESELMIDYDNVGELLESYMWTHILDAISLADISAERHFHAMITLMQPLITGIPSLYARGLQRPSHEQQKKEFFSLSFGRAISYEEGMSAYIFHLNQFSTYSLHAILLNLYMDNVADPLTSSNLLVQAFSIDILLAQYIKTLDEKTRELIMKTKIPSIVSDEFDNNKLIKIDQSEKEIRSLFQPLEVFNYLFKGDKWEICKEKTIEIIEKARKKAELDNP